MENKDIALENLAQALHKCKQFPDLLSARIQVQSSYKRGKLGNEWLQMFDYIFKQKSFYGVMYLGRDVYRVMNKEPEVKDVEA